MDKLLYLEALSSLQEGDVVLTPNRRLALFLKNQYQQQQLAAGHTCYQTPLIIPVSSWVELLWNDFAASRFDELPHVLNAAQEQQIWESILSAGEYQGYFLQLYETSKLVKSARGLLKQWQVATDHHLFEAADDSNALTHWIKTFENSCAEKKVIDASCLYDLVRTIILEGSIKPPARIFYAGFTEIQPHLAALLAACPYAAELELAIPNIQIQRTTANDENNEIRLCANWAKALHQLHPDKLIGCVIPTLDKKRERIAQIFTEVFTDMSAFNISAGQPLSRYPVIQAALQLLTLKKNQISADTLYFILSTPFIGGAETERIKRSQFDSRLRGKNFSTIHLNQQIARDAEERGLSLARSCPLLAARIRKFKALLEDLPQTDTYANWAQHFNQLLSALGWPGERVINSEEYQVIDEWLKLLHTLSTLDAVDKPVQYHQALRALNEAASAQAFQPESPAANVQILGILEASGLIYDALWICGLDDHSWPAQPKPNPFIPKKLQRELKMPHASAERELEYCQRMTKQFCQSAATVIFSHAKIHNETQHDSSPLLRSISEVSSSVLVPKMVQPVSELIFQHKKIEELQDELGPVITNNDELAGGVDIIKNQALCPFKAFAEGRLYARELESPQPGLRPKERGTIVHTILEKCWDVLQSSEQLLAITEAELNTMLDEIIAKALLEHAPAQLHQNSYLALEKLRLKKLIMDWLQLEMTRPPFVVANNEKSAKIKLNQLELSVRIDRIDQLADGKKLIIDYKTKNPGKPDKSGRAKQGFSINSWLGDRPDLPQLPLYAQLDTAGTAGIAFAQVAAGNHTFIGIAQEDIGIAGIKPAEDFRQTAELSWFALSEQWTKILTQLADDFAAGKAFVNPKDKSTCNYCKLKPLCRIHQTGEEEHADED